MNRFIQAEIRVADLGTDLGCSSQGSRGAQGRTTDFEPVDSGRGFETGAIAPDGEGIVRRLVVPPSDDGIDRHRDLGDPSLGRDRRIIDPLVLEETEPVQEAASRGDVRSFSRNGLDQSAVGKPDFKGSTDHPQAITIGHETPDVVTTRAELNERHGHDDLELGIRIWMNQAWNPNWTGDAGHRGKDHHWSARRSDISGPRVCSEVGRVLLQYSFGLCYPVQKPNVRVGGKTGLVIKKTDLTSPGAGDKVRSAARTSG